MEQLAEPGAIVLSPATLELVEGYVEVNPLGPRAVKGLAEPVEVYALVGAGAVRSRLQAATARGLTRFVGRDGELEQLGQALERARAGHGQVVAVVGDPGVGKSRLVYEVTHSPRTDGWLVLESGSVSYGQAMSYWPVIELLKGYFTLQDRDELGEIREKVTGKLRALDASLQPTLPALLALLEVPVDDVAWQTLEPAQRRQRTPRRGETAAAAGSQRATSAPARRGPALDGRRDPGAAGQPGREPARRAPAAARHVPARVSARLGGRRATTRSCDSIRCRRPVSTSCCTSCSASTRAWLRSRAC